MSEVIEEVLEDEGALQDCVEVQLEKLDLAAEDQKKDAEQEPQATGGWNVDPLPQASGGWDFGATSEKQPQEQENKFEMSNAWGVTETVPQSSQVAPSSQWDTDNQEQINQSTSGWNQEPQQEPAAEKQPEGLTSAWGESWGGLAELPAQESSNKYNNLDQRERGGGRGRGGPRVCFKCQQEGHMSRDCQNQSTGQRGCFKCGQEGHMSRDCTEPGQRGRGRGRGQQPRTGNENPHQQNDSWGQVQGNTEAQNSWDTPQEPKENTSWQQVEQTTEVPTNSWGSNDQQAQNNTWGSSEVQVNNTENTWNTQPDNNQNQTWNSDSNPWGGNQESFTGDNFQANESRENNRGRGRGRGRGDGGGGSRACFKCQQEGHMSRECPNAPPTQSRACFKCQQEGHMSRECPNAPTQSSRACFKCGKEGHMSRECTEPGSRGRGRGRGQPRENAENTNQENSWGQQNTQGETNTWGQPQQESINQGESTSWGQPQQSTNQGETSWGQPQQSTNQGETVSWGAPQQESSANQGDNVTWGQPISVDPGNQTTENVTWGSNPVVADDQAPVEWQLPTTNQDNKPNRDRPSKGCFKCGEEGHMSKECPKNDGQSKGKGCFKCGEEGHMSKECPKNDGQSKGKGCFKCGEEGHMSKECPNKEARKCFNCGSEEHISRDCQSLQIPDGPGGTCFKCGNYGHMARDCTGEEQQPTVLIENEDIVVVPIPRKKVKIGDPIEIVISDDDSMIVEQSVQKPIRLDTLDHIKQGIIKTANLHTQQYTGSIEFKPGFSIMCNLFTYDTDSTFLQTCPSILFTSNDFMTPMQKDYMVYFNQLIRLRQEERKELMRKQYMGVVQGASEQDEKFIMELAEELHKSGQSIRISYGIFYSDITFFHVHQVFGEQESIMNLPQQLVYVVHLKPKFFQQHENIRCYRNIEQF